MIAVAQQDTTMKDLERQLDFIVVKEPLYRQKNTGKAIAGQPVFNWHQVDRYALVRKDFNETIGTCSKAFQPVQMKDTILRNTAKLMTQGWRIPRSSYGRRSPIRIEGNGLRAYVEMVNEQASADIIGRHNTEKVYARFVQFNGFDLQTKFGGTAGGYQYSCANGIHDSFDFIGVQGHRHIGRGVASKVEDLERMAEVMLENFERISKDWKSMSRLTVGKATGLHAVEAISIRCGEDIIRKIDTPLHRDPTAWEWFSAITNWLTFEFKGSQRLFNDKQQIAKDILIGKVEPSHMSRFLEPKDRYFMKFNEEGELITKRGAGE